MANSSNIQEIIEAAVQSVIARVAPAIQRRVSEMASVEIERALATRRGRATTRTDHSRRRPEDLTKWAADRRARRVPKFVIEMTDGLDTKKKIVAKYGEGVVFEKGKPVPKAK